MMLISNKSIPEFSADIYDNASSILAFYKGYLRDTVYYLKAITSVDDWESWWDKSLNWKEPT